MNLEPLVTRLDVTFERLNLPFNPRSVTPSGTSGQVVRVGECMVRLSPLDEPLQRWTTTLACWQRAANAGITPPVLGHDADTRVVITQFVPGQPLAHHRKDLARWEGAGQLLRTLHDAPLTTLPPLTVQCLYSLGERFRQDPWHRQVAQWHPAAYAAWPKVATMVTTPVHTPLSLVHRDVHPHNLWCSQDGRIWLLDWEHGGLGYGQDDVAGLLDYVTADELSAFEVGYGASLSTPRMRACLHAQHITCAWWALRWANALCPWSKESETWQQILCDTTPPVDAATWRTQFLEGSFAASPATILQLARTFLTLPPPC